MKLIKKMRRKKIEEPEELDITSLLDVLVVLLIFLLQSFSSSELEIAVVDELTLPFSYSKLLGKPGTIIQVNADRKVWLNNNFVGRLSTSDNIDTDLLQQLENIAKEKKILEKYKNTKSPLFINLVFDKSLQYKDIQRVMDTSAKAGFGRYKFIVQGVD